MRCEDVLNRLWEYLDAELDPEEAEVIRAHVGACPHCYSADCCDRAFLTLLARQRFRCSAPPTLVTWVRSR